MRQAFFVTPYAVLRTPCRHKSFDGRKKFLTFHYKRILIQLRRYLAQFKNTQHHWPFHLIGGIGEVELENLVGLVFHKAQPGVERHEVLFEGLLLADETAEGVIQLMGRDAVDPLFHLGEEIRGGFFLFQDIDEGCAVRFIKFGVLNAVRNCGYGGRRTAYGAT